MKWAACWGVQNGVDQLAGGPEVRGEGSAGTEDDSEVSGDTFPVTGMTQSASLWREI